ncbi:DUF2489 domain-containing protein [Pseudomonas sp. F1_0610]|uniref:DUF2489 domain-containing protein n=1 Tax=Pseudomonas sp. F1_0610 TaxID=3114284 RepID=UPI0039C29BEF
MSIFIIVGLGIVIGLGIYTLSLWRKVWRQEKALREVTQERQDQLTESLLLIAKAFMEGQVPWIEGCIRLKVLLDNYDHSLSLQPQFQVLHSVYDAVKDTPSHDAWRALDAQSRTNYEQLFNELETMHKVTSQDAVQALVTAIRQNYATRKN